MNAIVQLVLQQRVIGVDELAGLRLFANADLARVAQLLGDCPVYTLRKDDVLLVPGVANRNLYVLTQGRLRVHADADDTTPLSMINAGEAIGAISAIDAKPASTYVIADTSATVLAIEPAIFWSLVKASHAIACNLLHMVVMRMRANNAMVAEALSSSEGYRRHTAGSGLSVYSN